ncbi:MAG TPA: exostosin family protein [Edaphobacter sp.]|jgi:hypothetical protein|nr:exostosin family protein [Edaphobacter sp.]
MIIHLSPVKETELTTLLPLRAQHSVHTLTDDPAAADLILLIGSFGLDPACLLDHPLYTAFPNKCAVYTEDDNYLPLAPGVYSSASVDTHSRAGRTSSYSYVSSTGRYTNQYVIKSVTDKKYLFTFQGGSTSLLRKRLFNLTFPRPKDALATLIENTSTYYHWDLTQPDRHQRQQRYAETIAASHFVLCPRGAGNGSIRLFEVMQAGIAPVLISDNFLLPPHVPWDTFLLRIPERDIARLPELIEPHLATSAERGRLAREVWLNYFAPEKEFDAIIAAAVAALHHGPPDEAVFRRRQARIVARANRRRQLRDLARNTVLTTLKVLRLKSPYQMNR